MVLAISHNTGDPTAYLHAEATRVAELLQADLVGLMLLKADRSGAVLPGILVVGSEHITFVKPGSVIFDLALEQVEFTWKSLPGTGRFGVKAEGRQYVLYTIQPRYADKLPESDLEKVSDGFKFTSLGAQFLGTSGASLTDWLGTADDIIEAFILTGDLVKGMRNYKRLGKRVDPVSSESS